MIASMLRFLTSGESHGPQLTVVIEGLPAGLEISEEDLRRDLARRQGGHGRGGRQKIETDLARIVSGVRGGFTIGSPVTLVLENKDHVNWTGQMTASKEGFEPKVVTRLRPGHADLAGALKYGHTDIRNVLERSSARETATRVAAGGIARKLLGHFGIDVVSFTQSIGTVDIGFDGCDPDILTEDDVEKSPVRCPDPEASQRMVAAIDEAAELVEEIRVDDRVIASLRAERVRAAVAALPAEQRVVLSLAFWSGLSQSEIAARTSTPLGTVKSRVRLGMSKLRDQLRPETETA